MTLALTGATGQLGRLAIAALKARGHAPIALVRDLAKAADLGTEARAFDYKATSTLAPALAGVTTLVLISSNDFDDRMGQHRNVIDAAQKAGVSRILYTSILRAETTPMLLAADHKATEGLIRASGLGFTFLRNGWYTENHTGSLGGAIAAGALIGSAGDGRFSSAARADYAEAIAVTATTEGHVGKIYELAGDVGYSYAELAAEVSRQTGKTIPYNDLPPATYAGILESFGLPAGFAHVLADSDVQAGQGALYDDSRTLSRLIGRPTTPMADTVAQALA
ncbi:NAD(P)-dependent oxidoreductase [Tabrizicola sp. TH137]|uniref:SDR family oxidoreductase n=1 Tax=Tabrizicola sp. TH137 TaxID=2067452 RepID=UPI000C7E204A|nr:SDR family oxidoreductase [Tabrizicola sp. TH137]PLL13232.1 NAD(P)-dependent oxidoreductase [Tabrizicola sp. TH137]